MADGKITATATAGRPEGDNAMTTPKGRVTCDLSISLDGYAAGHNQTEQRPFGDDGGDGWGDKLHAWFAETPDENRAEVDQAAAAHCAAHARRRHAAVRRRAAAETRAGEVASRDLGYARDLPRAVLSWRAVLHDYRGLQHRGSRP